MNPVKMKATVRPVRVEAKINLVGIRPGFGTQVARGDTSVLYPGPYEVTPTQSTQTLNTRGQMLQQNVVVNPIPSNYGLITWNGAILTVS